MNLKTISLFASTLLLLSLPASACLPQAQSATPSQSAPPTRIVTGVFIDWAYTFNDLTELCNYAEVIVIGTVDRVSTTVPFVPSKWSGGYTN